MSSLHGEKKKKRTEISLRIVTKPCKTYDFILHVVFDKGKKKITKMGKSFNLSQCKRKIRGRKSFPLNKYKVWKRT